MKVKVWAKHSIYSGLEVVSDEGHSEALKEEAEGYSEDLQEFEGWLADNYNSLEIWDMTPEEKEKVWKKWEEYNVNFAHENDSWECFELEV